MSSSPEEHKRFSEDAAAVAVAVAVTPEKPIKKQRRTKEESSPPKNDNDNVLTAESIMGFPRYPNVSNGEIMKHHYDFVLWAKKMIKHDYEFVVWAKKIKANGGAYCRLEEFVDWVESPEGQRLELESEKNVKKFRFLHDTGETCMEDGPGGIDWEIYRVVDDSLYYGSNSRSIFRFEV